MLVKKSNFSWAIKAVVIGATCASMNVLADEATIWSDSAGDVVNDGSGDCLHTIWWQKDSTCGKEPAVTPEVKKVKPMVETKPKPVAKPAPKFEPFRLSSAAAFELSGSTLSDEGKAEIKAFAAKLKGHKVNKITVEGYTDSSGPAEFNQVLSEKRANAVKDEMVNNGIDASLITAIGHGESNPIADNATSKGRAANRRVKVTVDATRQVQ
jgi:outer membrane protein OmpA-like peptidoglycan-associated protein